MFEAEAWFQTQVNFFFPQMSITSLFAFCTALWNDTVSQKHIEILSLSVQTSFSVHEVGLKVDKTKTKCKNEISAYKYFRVLWINYITLQYFLSFNISYYLL